MKIIERYALKYDDGSYHSCYNHPFALTCGIVCKPDTEVYKVTFAECNEQEKEYYSFEYCRNMAIDYIFKTKNLLSCCFPYGIDAEVKAGKGRIVYLKAVKEEKLGLARDIKNFPELKEEFCKAKQDK